jgi:tetratricopeptide (TPR) repeat protein
VAGVGESNYLFGYYEERRTDRNLSDPHSLPFRLLSETGLVGIGLFAVFLVSLAVAIARSARLSGPSERRWIAGLAAAGAVVIGQGVTDWLWLIPTVMGLGLLSLGLVAAPADRAGTSPARWRIALRLPGRADRWRLAGRIGSAAALVAATVSVGLLFLSDLYVREARSEAGESPQAQLSAAQSAEDLNPLSVTPLYLQASALESQGDRGAARDALLEALEEEPDNFVTLAVLGDLEVRAGNYAAARDHYARASELNPRDVGLRELARTAGA